MRPRPKQTLIRPVTTLPNDICGFLLEMVIFCGVETFQRVWNAYLSISLFHGGQEGNKESGNSDCILLSHLEINEATHKRGGAGKEEREFYVP